MVEGMMAGVGQAVASDRNHFARLVRNWSYLGSPLRPSLEDTAVMQRAVANLGASASAVVLGLTPEIIGCKWPDDVSLSAIDHSPAMMDALWPAENLPPGARAILADWCAMPLASASVDLVAGDGCYILLSYPDGFRKLTQEVCRVLRHSGRFAIRVFMRPDQTESIADIASALAAGEIHSVHALKLRLLAALHGADNSGTRLNDVWLAWKKMPPLPAALAGRCGWTDGEITGIESYCGMEARYFMPTLAGFRQLMPPELVENECVWGSYELAEYCPTLVFSLDQNGGEAAPI